MPELLIELFSEEIPARMQARAGEDFCELARRELAVAQLPLTDTRLLFGPRRIGFRGILPSETPGSKEEVRGPRKGAPRQAIDGFVTGKVVQPLSLSGDLIQAAVEALMAGESVEFEEPALFGQVAAKAKILWEVTQKGEFLVAHVERPSRRTEELLETVLPYVVRRVPWPKSMRWGSSAFAWVRPLQRVLCVFDGAAVPFALAHGDDAVHGLVAGDLTEGHRILAGTAPFAVRDAAQYAAGLRERFVIADAAERERVIEQGIDALAAAEGLEVVPDRGLLAEVAGLVEWPVPLLGGIDAAFMDLPAEVMRTTMRVNQRYFALRYPDGRAAPRFAIVANIVPEDGGAAIIAGNERVLRARLADARFFWDQDRKQRLEDFLPKLESVVFHAKLGTQGERVRRLERLAGLIAPMVGADPVLAAAAARLAKADLASGMVGEFPEVQGVMGRYYALAEGLDARVAEAIGAHYRPMGPGDAVPSEPVAVAVALADKLDQLAGFFAVGEKPTGSGDPFALRRAALGVIRIIRENGLRVRLRQLIAEAIACGRFAQSNVAGLDLGPIVLADDVLDFILSRVWFMLRAENGRVDVAQAAFRPKDVTNEIDEDDLLLLFRRADALEKLVVSGDGPNLLAAAKRAVNILRIETKKDGPHDGPVDPALLAHPAERALDATVSATADAVRAALATEDFAGAMRELAKLRAPLDAFFTDVVVNDPDPATRANRLRLLARLSAAMDAVADFSKIEG